MEYQDFERLYHGAPVMFHLGMDLRDAEGNPVDRRNRNQ